MSECQALVREAEVNYKGEACRNLGDDISNPGGQSGKPTFSDCDNCVTRMVLFPLWKEEK